jgi:SulP family sulfate permease
MAALVAVMIFVSAITFEWHSIAPRTLRTMPKSETAVMLITVVVVVATHNLAIGVGAGVLAAMAMFARRVAHFVTVERTVLEVNGENVATYTVDGELFFASSNDLYTQFEYALDAGPGISRVVVDLHASHLWDASTIAVLDAVTEKYRRHGREVDLIGLNSASIQMRERLAGKLNAGS